MSNIHTLHLIANPITEKDIPEVFEHIHQDIEVMATLDSKFEQAN